MPSKTTFPWSEVAVGGYFFTPTLAVKRTTKEGLVAAMHYNMIGKAEVGIYKGKYGVLFKRVR